MTAPASSRSPIAFFVRSRYALRERVRLVEVDDPEVLVHESGQVLAPDVAPDEVARHHPDVARDRRELVLPHDVRPLEAPLLAPDLVAVCSSVGIRVEDVRREPVPCRLTVLVGRECRDRRVPIPPVGRDGVPDRLEPLEGLGHRPVVRVERQEELATRLLDGHVRRAVVAAIGVPDVADRKVRLGLPLLDQLGRAVGRFVVDDQPLEVAECLRLQTAVWSVEGMRAISRARVHGEGKVLVLRIGHGSSRRGRVWEGAQSTRLPRSDATYVGAARPDGPPLTAPRPP